MNFPDVQARAQEELDGLVGEERSPELDDIEKLPYIQAVIKEVGHLTRVTLQISYLLGFQTHRWRPVAPTTLPHANTEDFTYKGYLIPKGTIIFINACGSLFR